MHICELGYFSFHELTPLYRAAHTQYIFKQQVYSDESNQFRGLFLRCILAKNSWMLVHENKEVFHFMSVSDVYPHNQVLVHETKIVEIPRQYYCQYMNSFVCSLLISKSECTEILAYPGVFFN